MHKMFDKINTDVQLFPYTHPCNNKKVISRAKKIYIEIQCFLNGTTQ